MCLMRKKVSVVLICSLIALVTACGLSSEQEMHLNKDLLEYIYARNNGDAIKQIGYTHPSIVKHYVEGDSTQLLERFQELPHKIDGTPRNLTDSTFIWENYYVMHVKSSGNKVQVNISIKAVNQLGTEEKIPLIAMSLNEGKNWVFLREDEMGKLN